MARKRQPGRAEELGALAGRRLGWADSVIIESMQVWTIEVCMEDCAARAEAPRTSRDKTHQRRESGVGNCGSGTVVLRPIQDTALLMTWHEDAFFLGSQTGQIQRRAQDKQ